MGNSTEAGRKGEGLSCAAQVSDNKEKHRQTMRGLWDTLERPNLQTVGIEEGEYCAKGIKNIFNKAKEENPPNIEKEMPARLQEAYRTTEVGRVKRFPSTYYN